MCQAFESRKKLSPFVCNCPVCNLTREELCISDDRREQIATTAQLRAGELKTASGAHRLLCKIKDARRLMLLERIGEGLTALKLSRLEVEVLK